MDAAIGSLTREEKLPFVSWTGDRANDDGRKNSQLTCRISLQSGRRDEGQSLSLGASGGGGHHTQLLRILLVWHWFRAKLLHFLQTQPHKRTFSGPKLSAQILPATLTTFVPITSLCGLKKCKALEKMKGHL